MGEISPSKMKFSLRPSVRLVFGVLLILLIVAGGILSYERFRWDTVEIMNAERSTTVRIHARPRQTRIQAISIRVQGKVDGIGAIALDGMEPEIMFSGHFDQKVSKRDWYSTTCDLHYVGTNVHTGSMVVSYRFHD
jgi:hypothetical protein